MSHAPAIVKAGISPLRAARPSAALGLPAAPGLARRLALRARGDWLPRAAWTIGRTGRPGLAGIALLIASALFLASTLGPVAAEVEALRTQAQAAPHRGRSAAPEARAPAPAALALPPRADVPAVLGRLFRQAARSGLAVDAAQYEVAFAKGGVYRYRITFPVTGPYPQVRTFIDETLATEPSIALTDLVLERKAIGDGSIEARMRMTIYARSDR